MTQSSGFYTHIHEAIATNTSRLPIYAGLTKGKSIGLSIRLILLERIAYLAAIYFDWRAAKFQGQGIPIIAKDFVSMLILPSSITPPVYRNIAHQGLMDMATLALAEYRKALKNHLKSSDFAMAAQASSDALKRIRKLETDNCCHFAMTVHIIESVGYACINAQRYAHDSKGETRSLSNSFIKCQALALYFSLGLDHRAQQLHRLGVGILVNDLPAIPFR